MVKLGVCRPQKNQLKPIYFPIRILQFIDTVRLPLISGKKTHSWGKIQGVRHSNFIFKMKDFFLLYAPFFALIHFFHFFPFVYYEFSFITFFPFLLISFPFFHFFHFSCIFPFNFADGKAQGPIQLILLAPSVLNFARARHKYLN